MPDKQMISEQKENPPTEHCSQTRQKAMTDIAQDIIGKYCIVRTYSAGVHAGILKSRDGKEVVLNDARRIWYWDGAATLSQLAVDGTSAPEKCKFPASVAEILLTEAIEIIPCTDHARVSIEGVTIWAK